ncbi:MAG: homoserine dehydrogenase, partial [Phycisphaerae bacterium]
GGTTAARQVVTRSLQAGKDVVTANKALLATCGPELFSLARRHGRCIAFEASCGGGIPLVESIRRGLVANRIDAIYGIVNGTCNYILTEMLEKSKTYQQALREAQQQGLAEADASLDVSGLDSAHKLAILAWLAFGVEVELERIAVEGIEGLELTDLHAGAELGYVCKLLAIGQRDAEGISLRVGPAFIRRSHPLASVAGPFNAVSVYGHATGHTLFYGRGAGRMPTASAVVADVVDVALGNARRTFQQLVLPGNRAKPPRYKRLEQIRGRYYLRLMVDDRPGVMAKITRVLGDNEISLSAVVQHETGQLQTQKNVVPVVVTTHMAREGDMRRALGQIRQLEVVREEPVRIGLVEEHEEF